MPYFEGDLRAPEGARFAIIASRWNPRITDALVAAARQAFVGNGVDEAALDVVRVPGAWELPVAARQLAVAGRHAAIVALGCVVRGDTRHYEQVADGTSEGLMRVALDTGVPVANGVLAVGSLAVIGLFRPDTPHAVIYAVLFLGGCLRSIQFTSLNAIADLCRKLQESAR